MDSTYLSRCPQRASKVPDQDYYSHVLVQPEQYRRAVHFPSPETSDIFSGGDNPFIENEHYDRDQSVSQRSERLVFEGGGAPVPAVTQ